LSYIKFGLVSQSTSSFEVDASDFQCMSFTERVMKLSRRQFVHLSAGPAALSALARFAWAQPYPARPVRMVVAGAPGGANDILARLMGPWLSERLGQQFVTENRPGGGGNIGTEAVVRAPSDGYTLLLIDTQPLINATLYEKLNYNFTRDIVPVAGISRFPYVLVVNPSVPANTVPELLAYAKANPGKINMGSPGVWTGPHVAGELFKMMAGVDIVLVPYRGGAPLMTDLLGGQVQLSFSTTSLTIEHTKAGRLRPLAVTTATRWEGLPDVPTLSDFVPDYEASSIFGLGAPKNTSVEIVDRLKKVINVGLDDPKIKARIADLGGTVLVGSPADFVKLIADETEKWGKVVKFVGAKAD